VDGSDRSPADPQSPQAAEPPLGPAAVRVGRQVIAYRVLGVGCALIGTLLVIAGLFAMRGKPAPPGQAAVASSSARPVGGPPTGAGSTAPPPSTAPVGTPPPTTAPPTTAPPGTTAPPTSALATGPPSTATPARLGDTHAVARAPLTVLNNTTRAHLAQRAAAEFRDGGWQVVAVGNYTGQISLTTAYYTPGSATERQAAEALAKQFRGIARVLPRFAGLPASAHGVVVVLAPDWS